jgi:hypothetical protein
MTKLDLVKANHIENETYDYALPQTWVDMVHNDYNIPYRVIIDNFVWLYDEKAKVFGKPFPLTIAGRIVCKIIGEKS